MGNKCNKINQKGRNTVEECINDGYCEGPESNVQKPNTIR